MPVSPSIPPHPGHRRTRWLARLLVLACLPLVLALWAVWPTGPIPVSPQAAPTAGGELIERGRYLATLGNCQGCHSLPGRPAYAGGTPIATPFGQVYGPNLTPSAQGLGDWSADDFWRAMHFGQRPDGRWLNPAFPYPNTTQIRREDSDALYAYLRSLPPDDTPSRPNGLRWPYNTQAALKVWRALYFRPADTAAPSTPGDVLAQGRYLVEGLGHCSACHAPRNRWGGAGDLLSLAGGRLPSGWEAPSLLDPAEAGVQGWTEDEVVALLGMGRSGPHRATGPMAEVVAGSLRHWKADDLRAVARHLQQLPVTPARRAAPSASGSVDAARGAALYTTHCASCHGEQGQGYRLANGRVAYPALAGNRTVLLASAANLLQTVRHGGYALATPDEPLPFGMPPFQMTLDDPSMAAVLTHLRQSWGHRAGAVTPLDLHRLTDGRRP